MGFFKKLGRSTGRLFKKASHGVSHTFKKAGKGIVRGVSSLAGGALGAEIGGGLALALAPEFAIPAMAVGGLAGRELGKEAGGIAYTSLEKKRSKGTPSAAATIRQMEKRAGKIGLRGNKSIPDGKFFTGNRVGANGGGIRQNPLEKSKPKRKEMEKII